MTAARPFVLNLLPAAPAGTGARASSAKTTTTIKG